MKNSILLKSLIVSTLIFCLNKANAQLASDMPAPVSNKPIVNSQQDSVKVRVLASEAPILNQNSPKTNAGNPGSGKVVLPSERLNDEKDVKKNLKKQ